MGDYYQPPEPGWKRDFDELRREVALSTRLVIWGFGISWVVITAMYAAGFGHYLPNQIKPLEDKLADIKTQLSTINTSLSELSKDVAYVKGKLEVPPPKASRETHPGTRSGSQGVPATTNDSEECSFPQAQQVISFGTVRLGSQFFDTHTLQNTSSKPLIFTSFRIEGTAQEDFSFVENHCVEPVHEGGSCSLKIAFSPREPATRSAYLKFDCNSTPQSFSLIGHGE